MKKLPISVLVLSILGLVVASFGLLSTLANIVIFTGLIPHVPAPSLKTLSADPLQLTFLLGSLLFRFILQCLLLISSLASLKLLPWARRAMLLWAWSSITITALGLLYNIAFVFPKMYSLYTSTSSKTLSHSSSSPYTLLAIYLVSMFLGLLLSLSLPLCVLYFFTRPKITNAFKGIFLADTTNFPVILDQPHQPQP